MAHRRRCATGLTCCGDSACCDPEFCCGDSACCDPLPCEECLDNGTLSGGIINVSPAVAQVNLSIIGAGESVPTCSAMQTVTVADTTWPPLSASVSASIPGQFTDSVNQVLAVIPGGHLSITGSSFSVASKERDCCRSDGIIVIDGESEGSGTLTFDIAGSGPIPLWGVEIKERTLNFGFVVVTLNGNIGITMGADLSFAGTGGRRQDTCDLEDCYFGSVGLDATASIGAGVSGQVCVSSDWGFVDETCAGMEITPLEASLGMSGGIDWQIPECDSGVSLSLALGALTVSMKFKVANYTLTESWQVYGGAQLLP